MLFLFLRKRRQGRKLQRLNTYCKLYVFVKLKSIARIRLIMTITIITLLITLLYALKLFCFTFGIFFLRVMTKTNVTHAIKEKL